jgi:radical SAM superfamily enzyme YgiQ (UPF0313 family)
MKITLYNPPVFYYTQYNFRVLPMLSLSILAAVLCEAGHDVEVVDLEALQIEPDKMTLPDTDFVGFTCLTIAIKGVQDSITQLRSMGYSGRIAVGGIHPTTKPTEALSWGADLVVTGECEGNITELVESGATGIQSGKPLPIEDIPMPAWDKHNPVISEYQGNYSFLRPFPSISLWTRGCPYRCIFCSNLIYNGQPTRYRPPVNITAEMADLKQRGIQNVYVYDDELVGTKLPEGWMKEIADRIEPLGLKWITQGRCSQKYITAELMADMKSSGCKAIFWGIESMSQPVLDAIRKHITIDDILHSLRIAKQAGIANGVFMMIGNYQETEEDLRITADALKKAYKESLIDFLQVFICSIMPGTEMERLSKEQGWYQPAEHGNLHMKKVRHDTPWLKERTMEKYKSIFQQVCPVKA